MRHFVLLVIFFAVVSSKAHACLGPFAEETLFFKSIPNPPPVADLVADVTLLSNINEKEGEATAKVLRVIKAADTRIGQGDKITLKFKVSSCGPFNKSGNKGIIIAISGADSTGRSVFYAYTYRDDDGKFWPPNMRKEQ